MGASLLLLGDLSHGKNAYRPLKLQPSRIGLLPLHVSARRSIDAVGASDVEIAGIELPGSPQSIWITQGQGPAPQGDQPLTAKLLERPIDVNSRETERIRQFRLGDRQIA